MKFGIKHVLAASLLVIAGGCHGGCSGSRDTPTSGAAAGISGGACRGWPSPQGDPGLECRRSVCRPCGGVGEHCCQGSERGCDTGLTCEWNVSADEVVCSACGHGGERCCDSRWSSANYCVDGAMCNRDTNTCSGSSGGMCAGATTYLVGYKDAVGCYAGILTVRADSASEAESCAMMQLAGTLFTTVPVDTEVEEYEFCQTAPVGMVRSTVTVTAFSAEDARSCAESTGTNCDWRSDVCTSS